MKPMKITQNVLAALSQAETDGRHLKLVGQLDRSMYLRVNEVLEAAGGKWNRKLKAHVFEGPAEDAIEAVILTGEIVRAQDFGMFETPADLADRVIELADINGTCEVLEPSAGRGALARPARQMGGYVQCYDLLPKNVEELFGQGFLDAKCLDFLTVEPSRDFDRVVMNPPFAKRADIHHIMHAWKFLKPYGRLVAIASASVMFRDDKIGESFRKHVEDVGGTIDPLPAGSFKESGTMVNTVLVTLTR